MDPKHYPPSMVKYQKSHPAVTVRFSLEEFEKIKKMAKLEEKSINMLMKEAIGVIENKIDVYEIGYRLGNEDGFKEARKQYEITFPCSICGKPMTMYPDGKMHNKMKGIIKEGGWAHSDCISHKKTR